MTKASTTSGRQEDIVSPENLDAKKDAWVPNVTLEKGSSDASECVRLAFRGPEKERELSIKLYFVGDYLIKREGKVYTLLPRWRIFAWYLTEGFGSRKHAFNILIIDSKKDDLGIESIGQGAMAAETLERKMIVVKKRMVTAALQFLTRKLPDPKVGGMAIVVHLVRNKVDERCCWVTNGLVPLIRDALKLQLHN
ncbi:hypothetical protein QFC22_003520 [Naganishia vaughanmartiniae]|uniref:Uncharacterized protein n=1 Tax=Naganishia vaughanmartiniae TaxID=1424756 RepID=A0ACC2X608_9TREE|nr:hypothetical protein QFC22_003520 [Naganishia vaughanmartiniae]